MEIDSQDSAHMNLQLSDIEDNSFDTPLQSSGSPGLPHVEHEALSSGRAFWMSKRLFDIVLSLALLPLLAAILILVFAVNPLLNKGPLLFRQKRMGRWGRPIIVVKIRSMTPIYAAPRAPDSPLEKGRITPFAKFLRERRIDELPQIWNVLRGELSLIGPRPDMWEHALYYRETVPGYQKRTALRPGVSGYAQIKMGYAEGRAGVKRKAILDILYLRNASWRLDAFIFFKTLKIVVTGFGAK
jgi:lipopolysaccharide/colanic/teichoic acid biosynthesis glycosyltransferase